MRPIPLLSLCCLLASGAAWAQDDPSPSWEQTTSSADADRGNGGAAGDEAWARDGVATEAAPAPAAAPGSVTGPQPGLAGETRPYLLPNERSPTEEGGAGGSHRALTNAQLVDGRPRLGAFLAGPGSMDFVLHHTLMGAAGGFAITAIPGHFDFTRVDSRTAMLLGTLAGAGLGFASSSWYQFNNWIDRPAAHYGVVNSMIGSMFLTGLVDTFSDDALVLAATAVVGAELGAWLSMALGTGELPASRGLMLATGGVWGLVYGALLMATLATSGTRIDGAGAFVPALLMAPGIGLGAMALASIRYRPSVDQLLRANAFGGAVGTGVLLLTALAAGGFGTPLPYVLGLVSSAASMSLVTLLWAEPAGPAAAPGFTVAPALGRQPIRAHDNPWR